MNEYLNSDNEFFWNHEIEKIKGFSFSPDHYDFSMENEQFEMEQLVIQNSFFDSIMNFCRDYKCTPYHVILTAAVCTLSVIEYKEEVNIWLAIANHFSKDIFLEMSVVSLPLCVKIDDGLDIYSILNIIIRQTAHIIDHQDISLNELLEINDKCSIQNINEISNVFFNFTEENSKKEQNGVEEVVLDDLGNTKYELNYDCILNDDKITIQLSYATNLFRKSRITVALNKMEAFLREILLNPFLKLGDISFKKVLSYKNDISRTHYDLTKMFLENVDRKPEIDAIIMEKSHLNYKQLYYRISQIILYLKNSKFKKNDVIAVIAEKNIDSIVCVLALFFGGYTYVPISKEYPHERIENIVISCKIKGIIYDELSELPNIKEVKLLYISELFSVALLPENYIELPHRCAHEIAYIMHTSGSTGKPKGVQISWGNWANYCSPDGISKIISSMSSFRILSVTNLEFDISITEIFLPFIYGGCCIIVPRLLEDELLFLKYTMEYSADVIQTTPTNLKRLMLFFGGNWLKYLKLVFVGGESFPKSLYDDIRQITDATICNVYGPTEATVWSTYKFIMEKPIYNIIGDCLYNYEVYIMQNDKEADIECVGEICIGGASIAIGYVDGGSGEEFREINGKRLYFTGDMGRRLSSQEIEFLGRKDTQIKKGGYRIELDEIAEIAKEIYGIQDAVVLIRQNDDEGQIYLYFTSEKVITIDNIRKHLQDKLPKYMMPTYFIELKEFPLTISGKINTKKLPIQIKEKIMTNEMSLTNEQKDILAIIKTVFAKDSICLDDNFWQVGGSSIKAVALVNAVEKNYGIRIKLANILMKPAIKDIVDYIDHSVKSRFSSKERYHATSAQKRIYAMQALNKNSISYNMPIIIRMHQYFEPEIIKNYVTDIINNFNILRTRFQIDENDLWQIVFPFNSSEIKIKIDDIDPSEEMKLFVQPFLLESESLFRVEILVTNEDEYILLDIHHIISDEISNNNILDMLERSLLYKEPIPKEVTGYGDYGEELWKQGYKDEEDAWREYFSKKKIERLTLPRENNLDFLHMEGAKENILLPKYTLKKLRMIAIQLNCSSYSILLTFLFILLKKICYQDIITVASPTSTRNSEKYENTLGLFVNTSIICCEVCDDKTIGELITEIQGNILFAIENVNYPFEKLANICEVESSKGQNPIFDVMFNFYEDYTYELFEPIESDIATPKVDLSFAVIQKGEDLFFECEYLTNQYTKNRIVTILEKYKQLLTMYLEKLNVTIDMCDTCLPYEKEIIVREFNKPIEFDKYKTKCLQDYLTIQARLHPDNVAILMDSLSISFGQLEIESNMLANKLIEYGVESEDVIPLIIHRSIEMFIGIWGILKAGCAYLPIKPEEPDVRKEYMVNNAGVSCIVCGKEDYVNLTNIFPNLIVICVDRDAYKTGNNSSLNYISKSNNLAYVIYTSGTTGNPKGVMVEHGSVINRIDWMVKKYGICSEDRLLFKTPFSFDVSVWEIFMGVFCGATVYILPDGDEKEPDLIESAISEYGISVVHFVPSMLNVFLEYVKMNCGSVNKLISLRYIFSSGEALKKDSVRNFYSLFNEIKLVNLYGPTEATVDVTHYECVGDELVIPIGKPIKNINIFILNGKTLTGIGFKGELCIAGLGVARGYINDIKLSSEKFVDNLFGYGKMYRTGDVACWSSSGDILFFGRKDRQVKIRGNRIELGEIEDKILSLSNVKDVKVFLENTRLIANIVGESKKINSEIVREELNQLLPNYMIPNSIFIVPSLSLSSNGKAIGEEIRTPIEDVTENVCLTLDSTDEIILNIVTEVLGHSIKMSDNFMRSGGDSIQAIFVANRLQKEGIKVLAKDIVASKELYDLRKVINKDSFISVEADEKIYSISPIMRDFFYEWPIKDKNYFNQSCLLQIIDYDEEKLVHSIKKIISNHDMLRAKFINDSNFVVEKYDDIIFENNFEKVIISNLNLSQEIFNISDRIQRSISLSNNVLYKFVIIQAEEKYYLYICAHHLIIDAVSWGILQFQMEVLYQNPLTFLPESTFFGQWTKTINNYGSNISILEKSYWLGIVKKMQDIDKRDTAYGNNVESEYSFKSANWKMFKEKMQLQYVDEKCFVLALIANAFQIKEPLVFDIENYGRGAIEDMDVTGTIGWFTLIFPMVIEQHSDIISLTKDIYETFDSIINGGIAYGLLKDEFRALGYERLQANYCFNYLGRTKNYVSDNFIEVQSVSLAADMAEQNSMGYDIVFNIYEADNLLKINMVYKSSVEDLVEDLCERMDILQEEINKML